MRIQKVGIALLLLLLLSGCASIDTASPEKTEEDALSIAALFQTTIVKWTAKEWSASPACRGAANCC